MLVNSQKLAPIPRYPLFKITQIFKKDSHSPPPRHALFKSYTIINPVFLCGTFRYEDFQEQFTVQPLQEEETRSKDSRHSQDKSTYLS